MFRTAFSSSPTSNFSASFFLTEDTSLRNAVGLQTVSHLVRLVFILVLLCLLTMGAEMPPQIFWSSISAFADGLAWQWTLATDRFHPKVGGRRSEAVPFLVVCFSFPFSFIFCFFFSFFFLLFFSSFLCAQNLTPKPQPRHSEADDSHRRPQTALRSHGVRCLVAQES